MWTCSNCNVPLPVSYDVCWQCGASRARAEDSRFRVADGVSKDELVDPQRETVSPPPWRWQFRLSSVLLLTTIIAVAFAIFPPEILASMAIGLPLFVGLWLVVLFAMAGLTCGIAFLFGTFVDVVTNAQRREVVNDDASIDDAT